MFSGAMYCLLLEFGKEGCVGAIFLKIEGSLVLGRVEERTWKMTRFPSFLCFNFQVRRVSSPKFM